MFLGSSTGRFGGCPLSFTLPTLKYSDHLDHGSIHNVLTVFPTNCF